MNGLNSDHGKTGRGKSNGRKPDHWDRATLANVVGVIDLLDGVAVHAIAGRREEYRPVPFCQGDPLRLAEHYFDLGVDALYVADLSAIQAGMPQWGTIKSLIDYSAGRDLWLDSGWRGEESIPCVRRLSHYCLEHANLHVIAASESCQGMDALSSLANQIGSERTWLGLDYRNGNLLGKANDESAWIEAAIRNQIGGVIVLDLAVVGMGGGPRTMETCRRIHDQAPGLRVLSGGGVRHREDIRRLQRAGCEKVLVASALFDN